MTSINNNSATDIESPSSSALKAREDLLEQNDGSINATSRQQGQVEEQPRTSPPCKRRIVTLIFFLLLLIIAAIGLFIAFVGNPLEFFNQQDPPGINETYKWETSNTQSSEKNGLTLIIENALEDSWTPYLTEYIQKWDAGVDGGVDPLTLSVQRVAPDSYCDPSHGRIKVCNGDYGNTDWRGVTYNMVQNGFIINSVVKMNDYWLQQEGDIRMKYTMCHELGHGFGLAHTDENCGNVNTGECMDYTSRPRGNLEPGRFNFELLADIYGSTSASASTSRNQLTTTLLVDGEIDPIITEKYHTVVDQIDSMACDDCVVDLGDGYQVEVHKLLLMEEDGN